MMVLKAVLIEDENNARSLLREMLGDYHPSIFVIGEALSVEDGIRIIVKLNPDLVFLDIDLMGKEGWEVLEYFSGKQFKVIITTAHEQFALRSYEYGVTDYLLKPITPGSLKRAIQRVENANGETEKRLPGDPVQELKVQVSAGLRYISIDRIVRFEAARNYSWIHLDGESSILISKNLSTLEADIVLKDFMRIHHSHLINPSFMHFFDRHTGLLNLLDGQELPISRDRKKSIIEFLARR